VPFTVTNPNGTTQVFDLNNAIFGRGGAFSFLSLFEQAQVKRLMDECLARPQEMADIAPISIWHRCIQEVGGKPVTYPVLSDAEVVAAAAQSSTIGQIGDFIADNLAGPFVGLAAAATGGAALIGLAGALTAEAAPPQEQLLFVSAQPPEAKGPIQFLQANAGSIGVVVGVVTLLVLAFR